MMTGCNDDLKTAPRKTAVSALPAVDAGCMKMVNDLPVMVATALTRLFSDQKRMEGLSAKELGEGATPMESEENDATISSDGFITGVIEGFYNRPWTRSSFDPL